MGGLDSYLMMYQPTGGRRIVKQQLKSKFLLVNFYFYLAQFQIKIARFPWYFLHTLNYIHKLQYFLKDHIQQPNF